MNNTVRSIYKFCIALFFGMATDHLTWAQTEEEVDGEVQDAEIVIEKERQIQLKPQIKQYEFIKWKPELKSDTGDAKDFMWFDFKEGRKDISIRPASVIDTTINEQYDHYIKAGYGNYGSPLLNVDLTKKINSDRLFGFTLRHKSFASGAIDDENSGNATTAARIYGKLMNEHVLITSSLSYQADRNYYYGYPEGTIIDRADIRHAGNFLNLSLGALGIAQDSPWQYQGQVDYKKYADNFNANENIFDGRSEVKYADVVVQTNFMLSKYEDSGIDQSRNYIRLNPYYKWERSNLSIDVGFSFSSQSDEYLNLSRNKLFPYAKILYPIDESFDVFAKLDGGFSVNRLYDLAARVGVLNQATRLANSERLIDLTAGLNGKVSSELSFSSSVNYKSVRYLPILINSEVDQSRLDVVYDAEVSSVFTISGALNYQPNNQHEISTMLSFYSYTSDGYDQIFHRPTSELSISGRHMLLPQLKASWNMAVLGGIVARNNNSTDPNYSLDTIRQLDVELQYQINKNWGAFLSGENLLNQEFEQYFHYPQRGIVVKIGATFRL